MLLRSYLESVLSPINYITEPGVGLDISDTAIRYAKFGSAGFLNKIPELVVAGEVSLGTDLIDQGQIKDCDRLADTLRALKNKNNFESVRISLPSEGAHLSEVGFRSDVSFKEILGTLDIHLEENVPFADAVLSCQPIADDLSLNRRRFLITSYDRQALKDYLTACHLAGLTPLSFEVDLAATCRVAVPKSSYGTYMIVYFGAKKSRLGIVQSGVLKQIATVPIGDYHLDRRLSQLFGAGKKEMLVEFKRSKGLFKGRGKEVPYDAIIGLISALASEIIVNIYAWQKHNAVYEDNIIQELILSGEGAGLYGLPEYLTETLGIITHRAEVWSEAPPPTSGPLISRADSYGYATAIGLALAGYENNL